MINFHAAVKLVGFALILIFYALTVLPALLFLGTYPYQVKQFIVRAVSFYSYLSITLFRIKVKLDDPHKLLHSQQTYLIVSNHLSYLDVLMIARYFPGCFVTSQEIRETPVLGQISLLAGCLFVERRNKSKLGHEIKQVEEGLRQGLNVIVFPEATSTNGESVLRFKRPLFQAALNSETPVLPITVNYQSIAGKKVTAKNRDLICWYGDMDFFPHLWEFLKTQETQATLTLSYPLRKTARESDTTELALLSHTLIEGQFNSFK